jgi:HD-GYP domain-containing protein (c-di-GMP phosphodiesterase class II)
MVAIVDVFSGMTEQQVYKPKKDAEVALTIMAGEMTAQLDQDLLKRFREMILDAMPPPPPEEGLPGRL